MSLQLTPRRSKAPRFPNCFREFRIRSGLSQRALGRLIGAKRQHISDWECGQSIPTLPNVLKLAKALGTLAEALYHGMYCDYPRREAADETRP